MEAAHLLFVKDAPGHLIHQLVDGHLTQQNVDVAVAQSKWSVPKSLLMMRKNLDRRTFWT